MGTGNRKTKPAVNRAEMDFKTYTMLGGEDGPEPSLVKYSDPEHTPASIRYSVKSKSHRCCKVLTLINGNLLTYLLIYLVQIEVCNRVPAPRQVSMFY